MNKYDIEKVVGQGSYGKALLCRRKSDGKKCIIKQISIGKLSRKELKATEQESCILSKLSHPNIVAFWESIVGQGYLNIVMEFADGGDLAKYIESRKPKYIPEQQVLHLFVQISLAIKHIHDRKILHRDLKAENIFLTSSGLCKLGDFGVSRILKNTGELAATQIGTPYYMSPEIMEGKKYNSKTDIWSLGVILYELACLKVPFDGTSIKNLAHNIINTMPSPLPNFYSEDLKALAQVLLAKSSKIRPSITVVLSKPVVKQRISDFLNETRFEGEFNHTVLHGVDIFKNKPVISAEFPLPLPPQPQLINQPRQIPIQVAPKREVRIDPEYQALIKQQRDRIAALRHERENIIKNVVQPIKQQPTAPVFRNHAKPIEHRAKKLPPPAIQINAQRIPPSAPHSVKNSPESSKQVVAPRANPKVKEEVIKPPEQSNKVPDSRNNLIRVNVKSPMPPPAPHSHLKIKSEPKINIAAPIPESNRPNFEIKADLLSNLEDQIKGIKIQMDQLKEADFPVRSKSPLPPSVQLQSEGNIQVIMTPSKDEPAKEKSEEKRGRVVIKGVDKNWLNALENQMGDLKLQMKQIHIESRSPSRSKFSKPDTAENSPTGQASKAGIAISRENSPLPSPKSTPSTSHKNISVAERVKWYAELEGKMSELLNQMQEIKKSQQNQLHAKAVDSESPNRVVSFVEVTANGKGPRQAVPKLSSNSPLEKPWLKANKVPSPKQPNNPIVQKPDKQRKRIPLHVNANNNRLPTKPADYGVIVGKSISPKLKSLEVDMKDNDSKEKFESRKIARENERSDFRSFIQAQKQRAKREVSESSDLLVILPRSGITPNPAENLDLNDSRSTRQDISSIGNISTRQKSKSPVPLGEYLKNNASNEVGVNSKSKRDIEREEMRRMIAERRKQNQKNSTGAGDLSPMEVVVKEPYVPLNQQSIAQSNLSCNDVDESSEVVDMTEISINRNSSTNNVDEEDGMGDVWERNYDYLTNNMVDTVTAMEYSCLLAQMQQILQLPTVNPILPKILEADDDQDSDAFEEEELQIDSTSESQENSFIEDEEEANEISDVVGDDSFASINLDAFPEGEDSLSYTDVEEGAVKDEASSLSNTVFQALNKALADEGDHIENDGGKIVDVEEEEFSDEDQSDESIKREVEMMTDKSNDEITYFMISKVGKERFNEAYSLLNAIEELVDNDEEEEEFLQAIEDILGTEGLPYLELMYKLLSN